MERETEQNAAQRSTHSTEHRAVWTGLDWTGCPATGWGRQRDGRSKDQARTAHPQGAAGAGCAPCS